MFQRILKSPPDKPGGYAGMSDDGDPKAVPTVEDDQPLNPFTEIQILTEHSDILKFLVQIDEQRCCTGGDDHLIIIWDVHFGKRLNVLDGHTRPLTCLSVCQSPEKTTNNKISILLSAASDKLICMWNVDTGHLLNTVSDHNCTARAFGIFKVGFDLFCSGGENLCMWNFSGEILYKASTREEDIQQILILSDNKAITVADKVLSVYSVQDKVEEFVESSTNEKHYLKQERELTSHRDTVTSLIEVNNDAFVSGSLDGTIILWSSKTLERTKYLSLKRTDYQGSTRLYPYSVQHMLCVDERYLVCAMGSGFYIQDTVTEKHLAEVWNAHYSKVLHVAFVFSGLLLATCSEDGSVRLWGNSKSFKQLSLGMDPSPTQDTADGGKEMVSAMDRFLGFIACKEDTQREKSYKLELLGECLGHTGAVQKCISLEEGYVSCGKDGIVIVWKDGLRQEMRRNEIIRDLLYGASADFA